MGEGGEGRGDWRRAGRVERSWSDEQEREQGAERELYTRGVRGRPPPGPPTEIAWGQNEAPIYLQPVWTVATPHAREKVGAPSALARRGQGGERGGGTRRGGAGRGGLGASSPIGRHCMGRTKAISCTRREPHTAARRSPARKRHELKAAHEVRSPDQRATSAHLRSAASTCRCCSCTAVLEAPVCPQPSPWSLSAGAPPAQDDFVDAVGWALWLERSRRMGDVGGPRLGRGAGIS